VSLFYNAPKCTRGAQIGISTSSWSVTGLHWSQVTSHTVGSPAGPQQPHSLQPNTLLYHMSNKLQLLSLYMDTSAHIYAGCWLVVQCFTSPPTQYRLYGRRFLQVKWPNQQYQSTEGDATKENAYHEVCCLLSTQWPAFLARLIQISPTAVQA